MVEHAVRSSSACATRRSRSTPTSFLPRLRALVRHHDAPVYTITYYVHWLLMECDPRARLPRSRSAAPRPTSCSPATTTTTSPTCARSGTTGAGDAPRGAPGASTSSRSCATRILSNPDLFVDDPELPRSHLPRAPTSSRRYLTRRRSTSGFARSGYTDDLLRNRMLNELFARGRAGDPARGRPQRDVLLDREPLAVPRPRAVRVLEHIPTRHLCATDAPRRCCASRCAASRPTAILDNRRKVGFNAPILDSARRRRPRGRATLLADSPIFELVRRDKIAELLARPILPNSESKFLFYFVSAKLFLEEFADLRRDERPRPIDPPRNFTRRRHRDSGTSPTSSSTPTSR